MLTPLSAHACERYPRGTTASVEQRRIGDVQVGAIGLGAMPLSTKDPRPSPAEAEAVIHAALDAGVTLIDTADAYARDEAEFGHNESLVAAALASYGGETSSVLVATKGGHTRRGTDWELDGSPAYLRRACEASLRRLGVEAIGLYQFHRPDPRVPFAESVGAVRDLLDDGVIRMAGISNANPQQIREAQDILGGRLASVQNEFSPAFRSSEPELRLADELGIAFLPWSPLGGISSARTLGSRFEPFQEVAAARGISPQVVALAWHLAQSPKVIPIPGSSRPETIRDSVTAVEVELTPEELTRLNAA
jgi:aryl-alcohol dehydrogenase-like predicted oxidoreductase